MAPAGTRRFTETMVAISRPTLSVKDVPGHPGRRLVVVEYDLVDSADEASEMDLTESVVVHAVDLGDAPVRPSDLRIELRRGPDDYANPRRRRFMRQVARVELDVEQDWWHTGLGGEIEPLSEFADHLIAEITVHEVGPVLASARTPMVTGSWGALGAD